MKHGRGIRQSRAALASGLAAALIVTLSPISGPAGPQQLPDLRPRTPRAADIGMGVADFAPGERALRFTTMTENVGLFPLEIVAVPGEETTLAAMQCDQWVLRACVHYRESGTMVFDEFHSHWHFEDFAQYELRHLTSGGSPDDGRPAIAMGDKASFCLMDTQPRPEHPSGSQEHLMRLYPPICAPNRQGISPQWMDVYTVETVGQEIRLTGVPDGDYALVFRIDPDDRIAESNEDNNVAYRAIRISGNSVTVIGP